MHSGSATGAPHVGCCAPTRGFWKQGSAGSTALLARCCPGSGPEGSRHHVRCCSTAIRAHPAANMDVPTAACLGTCRNLVADKTGEPERSRGPEGINRSKRREESGRRLSAARGKTFISQKSPQNRKGGNE